jgi:hypothetical protein
MRRSLEHESSGGLVCDAQKLYNARKQLTESSIFQSQPLYILVGSEQTQLSIHSAVIKRFPQPLREYLEIPQRLQGEEPIVVKDINPHTFALTVSMRVQ